ncbi:hypothetical protein ACNKHO_08125 [Shigella flexneri]
MTYSEYSASLILLGRNEEKLAQEAVAREMGNAAAAHAWYTLDF